MVENSPYLDEALTVEERTADLLSRMTLAEKVGQLRCYLIYQALAAADSWEGWQRYNAMDDVGRRRFVQNLDVSGPVRDGIGHFTISADLSPEDAAVESNRIQQAALDSTRLGIPVLLHHEGLHGFLANGSTVFPQAIGLSCTWNPDLLEAIAAAIGREAHSRGVRQLLSPTLNIARDPRAGRTEETYGEDPYLTGRLAVAFIRGVQSQGVAATPKHFAANFMGDGGRDSHPIAFSEQHLREVYFPAFEAAVREGGAMAVMAAYNSIDGMPCSCNAWLLTDVLRGEWGFNGCVVSDYWSVSHLQTRHGVASTPGEAGKRALEAGLDVELPEAQGFGSEFLARLEEGSIAQPVLDAAVRRVLELKFRVGLFDQPFVDPHAAARHNHTAAHCALALQAARESVVLLKNEGVLPIAASARSIAVLGPLADVPSPGGYSWDRLPRDQFVTPLDGLAALAGGAALHHVPGCAVTQSIPGGIQAAVACATHCDLALVFVGNNRETEGEGKDRSDLTLPGPQAELVRAVAATGTPSVVVLMNGSPVLMGDWVDSVSALVEAWYPGELGGQALAEILMGRVNPSGKLTVTYPRSLGQLPLYYNSKPSGRDQGYVDGTGIPLFPFGFGLSYTTFTYHDLIIRALDADRFSIHLTVHNAGNRAGAEVVQLYVHDVVASHARPCKELKGFRRVNLEAGESRQVTFELCAHQTGFYDRRGTFIVEAGEFDILIGSSSEDIRLAGRLTFPPVGD